MQTLSNHKIIQTCFVFIILLFVEFEWRWWWWWWNDGDEWRLMMRLLLRWWWWRTTVMEAVMEAVMNDGDELRLAQNRVFASPVVRLWAFPARLWAWWKIPVLVDFHILVDFHVLGVDGRGRSNYVGPLLNGLDLCTLHKSFPYAW